jgi:hypothetical protein
VEIHCNITGLPKCKNEDLTALNYHLTFLDRKEKGKGYWKEKGGF